MKTLKKTLCLVLAVVMAVGVLVIPANAATNFPDDDKITHDEAVAVLNGLGIFEGDDKGNFNPDTVLKRAEAAKIIAYLMLGEDGAEDYVASSEPFTDMSGSDVAWAVNYVAYCADNDIVGGNGDGTFTPKGELTGAAFAKMLLCALGYDGQIEGFGTSDWAKNVESIARKVGLNTGLTSFQYSAPLSRDKAAQMAYNALNVGRVTGYKGGTEITLPGGVTITQGAERTENEDDTLWNEFKLVKLDGTTGKEMEEGGKDDFGRPSKYQIAIKGSTENTVLYSQPIAAVKTYTAQSTSPKSDFKASTGYTFADSLHPTINGADDEVTTVTLNNINSLTGNGTVVEVYCTSAKVIDVIVVVKYQIAQISDISSDTVTLVTGANYEDEIEVTAEEDNPNAPFYELLAGMEEDDYVIIAADAGDTILEVNEATVVSGTLTGMGTVVTAQKPHHKTYTIGGERYNLAAGAQAAWTANSGAEPQLDSTNDVVAVLDHFGNLMDLVEAKKAESSVLSMYVVTTYTAAGEWGDVPMFQGVLPNGDVITGQYAAAGSSDGVVAPTTAGAYQYSYDSKNDVYAFKTAAGGASAEGAKQVTGSSKNLIELSTSSRQMNISNSSSTVNKYFASDVTFVYISGEKGALDVSVATGVQKIKLQYGSEDGADYVVLTKDSAGNYLISTVYVIGNVNSAAVVAGEDLIYVKDGTTNKGSALGEDGETTVYEYDVYINGEKTTIITTSNTISSGWFSYEINEETGAYSLSTDGVANVVSEGTHLGAIDYVEGIYYVTYNGTLYDATDATVVDLRGTKTAPDTAISTMAALKKADTDNADLKVVFTYDDDAETIDLIYVLTDVAG